VVDDEIRHEWSFIPHFYYNFYVFQYATSVPPASAALSEQVLAGDDAATERYLRFRLGRRLQVSDRAAQGPPAVDMTTPEPLELTMRKMNRVIERDEALLDKLGR